MRKRMRAIAWSLFLGMLLVSCVKHESKAPGPESAGIEGIQWYLQEVAGSEISALAGDKQPHILLDPVEKKVTGFSGCNNFFGGYELNGSSLTFGPMGATHMACPDLERSLEIEFFKALDGTSEGVLFAIGGISSRFTVYMDKGVLKAEYNAMTLNRYKTASKSAVPTGKVKIEVETKYDTQERLAPATVTLTVNGKQVGQGRIERLVPALHTASETFDVGRDLGSPVAMDYFDRAPFPLNGRINRIHIAYTDKKK